MKYIIKHIILEYSMDINLIISLLGWLECNLIVYIYYYIILFTYNIKYIDLENK